MLLGLRARIRKLDWWLLVSVILLVCVGLTAIYSVELSREDPDFSFFKKQLTFFVIGLVVLFFFASIHYSFFRLYAKWIYLGAGVLLLLVIFFGQTIRGTTGWFSIFGLGFQPVELAKLALIVILAKFFSNRFQHFAELKHIIGSGLLAGLFVLFVVLQPDLGSAMVLFGVWAIMLLLTKIRKHYVVLIAVALIVIIIFSWVVIFQDYQKERIKTFLNPTADPLGSGYNVQQAVIAVGAGELWGSGLGFGSQSQLKFLPESQTDFIFAVVAEELGFVGVVLILGFWLIVLFRLIRNAQQAPDDFGQFLLVGIVAMFTIHLLVNVGMNLGIMPVTGISLPFLSYGGSFLLTSMLLIGVAESVISQR